jgi:acetyl esterase/lipase
MSCVRTMILALAFALLLVLAGCSPLGVANHLLVTTDQRVDAGVAYGSHPRQRLDVYRPAVAHGEPVPVVVFFYGGSWKRGDRASYRFVGEAMAEHGFLAVIADYRTWPEVRFPAFVEDAAAVTAWSRRHAPAYGGDPRRVVVAGHSAGAHIASLLVLDPRYLAAQGLAPGDIAGFVGLAGPYAFHPLEIRSVRPVFEHLADIDQARPITFANASAPPVLLLHGTADTTVLAKHSRELAGALAASGASAELREYPGIGHAGLLAAMLRPLRGRAAVLEDVATFLGNLPPHP